jgi:hypothetical protein
MKKKIIVLFPYKFTDSYFFRFGFDLLQKKNCEIEIHDLSDLFISKKFQGEWKVESFKEKNLKFKSILSWFYYITKIPTRTCIINLTNNNFSSINSFFIKVILSIKFFLVFTYNVDEVLIEKPKRDSDYIISKIFKEHKYDIIFYFNFIKKIIFFNLNKIVKYKKEIILTNIQKKNQTYIKSRIIKNVHSFDYSNFLRVKRNKNINNKYFVYLDTGFPYFSGDNFLDKSINFNNNQFKIKKFVNNLNYFFHSIEKKFKKRVLIVFHPKFRLLNSKKTIYNFFKNFKIFNKIDTNEAVRQAYCVLINTITTSTSFAVLNYRPIIFLDSQISNSLIGINDIRDRKKFLNLLNLKSINLDHGNSIDKNDIKVDRKAYDKYRFRYLQNSDPNLSNKFNSDIIYDAILSNSNFEK